ASVSLPGSLFQAEDGIRGFHVTGVQTCALPICPTRRRRRRVTRTRQQRHEGRTMSKHTLSVLVENKPGVLSRITSLFSRRGFNRSEERRVGEACRSRPGAAAGGRRAGPGGGRR